MDDIKRREFLHSLSRISDRLELIENDTQDIQQEAMQHTEMVGIKAAKIKTDTKKLRAALDSLAQDYLGMGLEKFKEDNKNERKNNNRVP